MWGTNKPELETPPALPKRIKAPEISSNKPVATSLEAKVMSADVTRPSVLPSVGSGARLGASLYVKGEITGNEDLHVDGTVEGLIQLEDRKLTVGVGAKLTADIMAREIVVYGTVKGNLRARDRIEIKKDGSVIGDLTTARIMIEDGAYFKGAIEIDRSTSDSGKAFARPAYSRALSTPAATIR